jgi:uncharacterized SAM-binding protein YcdF (DUF218 family)
MDARRRSQPTIFVRVSFDRLTLAKVARRFCILLFWLACAWIVAATAFGYAVLVYPQQTLAVESGDVKADVIIVLGGGRDERPHRAAELFQHGDAPLVLVSGVGDCEANKQILIKNGVPADVITEEPNSDSTYENAEFSVPLLRKMGAHRVIIVTTWYHCRRALVCFQHFAPDLTFYSRPSYIDYHPDPSRDQEIASDIKFEYLKLMIYWFYHGIAPWYRD